MRSSVAVLCLVAFAVAGCFDGKGLDLPVDGAVAGADFSHLNAPGAQIVDTETTRTFLWDAISQPGGSIALVGQPPGLPIEEFPFEVDGSVGYVEAAAKTNSNKIKLVVLAVDDQGRIGCGAMTNGGRGAERDRPCTIPVPEESSKVSYSAQVTSYGADNTPSDMVFWTVPDADVGDVPFQLQITLHPRSHLTYGDVDDQLDQRFTFRNSDTGISAGEPTLGVNAAGTIFAVENTNLMRSKDDGKTWEDVAPAWDAATFDPMMYLDPYTGRVFTSHLYIGCSTVSWSDDEGATWVVNPAACGMPYDDHQKLAVGGAMLPAQAFDGSVYYTFNSFFEGMWASRSLDGGATWTTSLVVSDTVDTWYPYRTGGPVAADREGNVYIPSFLDKGGFGVAVSNDYGTTWTPKIVGDKSLGYEGIDPGMAIDVAGNAYASYEGFDAMRVVSTQDKGATWSEPTVISPPGLTSFILSDAVAGDAGRVAVAYLATADTTKGPNFGDGWARWHLYLSMTENALDADPTWVTTRVTPEDDPVQIGTICTGGVGCFGGNRNLLDFIDIQAGPDGRVYIAYTDGCMNECALPQESREDNGVVAIQDDGPRLFVTKAPWA